MKNFTFFKKLMTCLFLLLNYQLFSQQVIVENVQENPNRSVKYQRNSNKQDYTKILDENGRKVYILNHLPGQNNTPFGKESVDDVTLNINLVFDPDQYNAPWVIDVFDETGYHDYAFWEGTNPVTINVPPGSYDIVADFTTSGATCYTVVKELVDVQNETTVEVDVDEADNYITTAIYNEAGEPLEPGVYDPETGTITGGNAEVMANRSLFFAPVSTFTRYSYDWGAMFSEEEEPMWNFYISDVSDRYSIIQSIFGLGSMSGLGYEGDNYFTKYETLMGISESVNLENNPEDWVFHQEKFRPSPLGEAAGAVYPGFSALNTWEGNVLSGWTVLSMGGNELDPEVGFKAYLNNPYDENPSDLLVFPGMLDYIGIINPEWGEEGFLITGNAIVAGDNNEVIYGSGVSSFGWDFLGNEFYNTETELRVLPFHPQFSFTSTDNPDIKQGNNTPIAVSAVTGEIKSQYKGRYGETRESDFFNTHVEIKQNNNIVFSGSYSDFMQFSLPGSGLLEATFTNLNIEVDGLSGKNTTQLIFDRSGEDSIPPTLQMLQFRDISGKVTDRFTSAAEGTVRLAAGDFEFIPEQPSHFAYNEGNTVGLYYSLYDQNEWTELPLTEYPEHFFMPAFGDYYEASLASIQNTESDVWYDVRIVCTDAAGNKQEQVVSPAFKINITVGTEDLLASPGIFYPNPVTDILTVENQGNEPCRVNIMNTTGKVVYSGPVTNVSTQSINMKSLNIPSGMYFIQLVSNHRTIAGGRVIYKN